MFRPYLWPSVEAFSTELWDRVNNYLPGKIREPKWWNSKCVTCVLPQSESWCYRRAREAKVKIFSKYFETSDGAITIVLRNDQMLANGWQIISENVTHGGVVRSDPKAGARTGLRLTSDQWAADRFHRLLLRRADQWETAGEHAYCSCSAEGLRSNPLFQLEASEQVRTGAPAVSAEQDLFATVPGAEPGDCQYRLARKLGSYPEWAARLLR